MRTLLGVLMIAGMLSTVGVYAAGFGSTPTTKTLAGSGNETISAPNTGTVNMGYVTTGDTVTTSSTEASAISTAKVVISQN